MLTKEHAIVACDFRRGRIFPDRLTRKANGHYAVIARHMLDVYRRGQGKTRKELHRRIHALLQTEPDCPLRRIDAFCKLLDDVSRYRRVTATQAARLRREVFQRAAPLHPLVESPDGLFDHQLRETRCQIAASLGKSWEEIESDLFADVIDFHRLESFANGYADETSLLSRYNVAQVQATLLRATGMNVWARADFKRILRQAKLARLMHTIRRETDGQYLIRLDGPASLLRQTHRYGSSLAKFLPALIACSQWRLSARIRVGRAGQLLRLELSDRDGLRSHLPPTAEFDSQLEEKLASKWGTEQRDGWRMIREGEILHDGQHVFVPDFSFYHSSGKIVLMEIVGYWTPEYLDAKRKTLARFRDRQVLLAVAESLQQATSAADPDVLYFKNSLPLAALIGQLNRRLGHN